MSAAAIVVGALLCWNMPDTTVTHDVRMPVEVVKFARIPSTVEPAAWVRAVEGRLAGNQWLVRLEDLAECKAPATSAK